MEKIYISIDHQSDPKRKSKYRLRVIAGTGNSRREIKAIYFATRVEALKMKKHLRDVINALQGDIHV